MKFCCCCAGQFSFTTGTLIAEAINRLPCQFPLKLCRNKRLVDLRVNRRRLLCWYVPY